MLQPILVLRCIVIKQPLRWPLVVTLNGHYLNLVQSLYMLAFSFFFQFLTDGLVILLILKSSEVVDEPKDAFGRPKTSLCCLDHPATLFR